MNTLTLSKTDSYKESIQTKLQIHSLSAIPNEIREYLDGIRPQRKRKSELRAFQELSKEYSSEDIAECLKHVLREGLPGGESCHSPLAFLAVGMDEVLRAVTETLEKCRLQREREDRKAIEIMCEQEQIEQERRELERQERAFSQAFHAVDRQAEVIRELCCRHGFPTSTGAAARAFAIGVWSRGWQKAEMAG